MKNNGNISLSIAMIFIFSSQILAGGFQINEHGARSMGMGGAFTAQASDPSAIYFNPAGLGFQKGLSVMLGTTLIFPSTTFIETTPVPNKTKMQSQIFYLSNFYATYSLDNRFVFGLGLYSPFKLETRWAENWVGKQFAITTDLKTSFVNPSIAYRYSEDFSIGIGISYVSASFDLKNSRISFSSEATGINLFNAGFLYKPLNNLSFAASYRHSTELNFKGTGSITITLPNNIFTGIAYDITPALTIEGGCQYVGWKSYDSLIFNTNISTSETMVKNWENTYLMRLGGEYRINQYSFRAGYVYDKTPQPDKSIEPTFPDANRNEFTLGVGYKLSDALNVDFAYQLILFLNRTITAPTNLFPGTYKSTAHLFGINVGYQF